MGLADAIFKQMNTIGEPLTSTSESTITPGQQPFNLGSIGLMLMMMMMNQDKTALEPPQLPMGMGMGMPDTGLMPMSTEPAGLAGGGIGMQGLPQIFQLISAALG